VLVAGVAVRNHGLAKAFDAMASSSVDPSQRARILMEAYGEANSASLWGALFVLPVALCALVPLLARTGHAVRGLRLSWGGALGVLLGGALAVGLPSLQSARLQAAVPPMFRTNLPQGIRLAELAPSGDRNPGAGPVVYATPTELLVDYNAIGPTTLLDSEAGCAQVAREVRTVAGDWAKPRFAFDRELAYGRMACLASAWVEKQSADEARVHFVGALSSAKAAPLPPPFDDLGPSLAEVSARFGEPASGSVVQALHLGPAGWTLVRTPGEQPLRHQAELAGLLGWLAASTQGVGELLVTAAPEIPSGTVLAVLALHGNVTLGAATTADTPPASPRAVEDSRAAAGKGPVVRGGAMTVTGRLAPEVIQRVVRQSSNKVRACYQQGLARNPSLEGKVTARFVIDRDGAVTTVGNGGSDLADQQVVACVLKSFNTLLFPQPEGGIVTVVYPMTFIAN
jgi:hypothetical protein